MSDVSEEDYEYAHTVYDNLCVQTLGEYMMYYLAVDVCLLQDIMEAFRDKSFKQFGLDPAFYYTLPSFSIQCCLKFTNAKIGLINDPIMYSMIRRSLRGGICSNIRKNVENNNRYLHGGIDTSKDEKSTIFLDFNGLYSYVMSNFPLVSGEYSWVEGEEFEEVSKNILNVSRDSEYGFIICADIDYPEILQKTHNDLPFLVEHLKIGRVRKLVPNLYNKRMYTLHYLNLQQCVRHGLILRKIHKIIRFRQSKWLGSYIDLCATARQNPLNTPFENKYHKLCNNCIFGKMLETTENYCDVKLLGDWQNYGKVGDISGYLKSARFRSFTIFHENFVAIEMAKLRVKCNRPIAVGFSILELSKFHLYEFYYSFLLILIEPSLVFLNYCGTDSLCISFKDVDFYEFMKNHPTMFDTSDYPVDNVYGIDRLNRKVPGLMNDQGKGVPIKRALFQAPKAYIIEFQNVDGEISNTKKLKSVSHHVTRTLQFREFYEAWANRSVIYKKMYRISLKDHVITTVRQNKVTLGGVSVRGEKRFFLPDNINSLAYGHKDCPIRREDL